MDSSVTHLLTPVSQILQNMYIALANGASMVAVRCGLDSTKYHTYFLLSDLSINERTVGYELLFKWNQTIRQLTPYFTRRSCVLFRLITFIFIIN